MGEETNEKRKMSQAWKNRIWNGSILAAFVAAMAVFVFCCRQKESAYGIRKRTGMRGNGSNSQGRKISAENAEQYITVMEIDKRIVPETALKAQRRQAEE